MLVSLVLWEVDAEMESGWEVLFVKPVKDKREPAESCGEAQTTTQVRLSFCQTPGGHPVKTSFSGVPWGSEWPYPGISAVLSHGVQGLGSKAQRH